eukprot:5726385-Prymnesium_polylepis.1
MTRMTPLPSLWMCHTCAHSHTRDQKEARNHATRPPRASQICGAQLQTAARPRGSGASQRAAPAR